MLLLSRWLLSRIACTLDVLQEPEELIGAKIRELREKYGWSQDEFAGRAGINRVHLYRIETGKQSPTVRTLAIVAAALKVQIRDLIGDL